MSARNFRSVGWVAGVAATALGCYMISLQVASTRASLEEVETQIVIAQRDVRVLQTEIGTRGRLAQLEKWNVRVLALSAPQANQFLDGGFQLASMVTPKKTVDPAAPVVLASAPAPAPRPVLDTDGPDVEPQAPAGDARSMMHVASLSRDLPAAGERASSARVIPSPRTQGTETRQATPSPKPAERKAADASPGTTKATDKKVVDKPKPVKAASADSAAKAAKPKESPAKSAAPTPKTTKSKEAKPKQ